MLIIKNDFYFKMFLICCNSLTLADVECYLSSPCQVTSIVDFDLDHILGPPTRATLLLICCFLTNSAFCLDVLQFLDAVLDGGYD